MLLSPFPIPQWGSILLFLPLPILCCHHLCIPLSLVSVLHLTTSFPLHIRAWTFTCVQRHCIPTIFNIFLKEKTLATTKLWTVPMTFQMTRWTGLVKPHRTLTQPQAARHSIRKKPLCIPSLLNWFKAVYILVTFVCRHWCCQKLISIKKLTHQ